MNDNIRKITNITKKLIRQPNMYTMDYLKRSLLCVHNAKIRRFQEQIEKTDPIADFRTFREIVLRECPAYDRKVLMIHCYAAASIHYGYYYEFVNFCGERDIDLRFPAFTLMEHGIVTSCSKYNHIADQISYCYFSNYNQKDVYSFSPNILYFAIGPYIHYSRKYYDEQQEKNLKDKLGRTLLVIPRHYADWENGDHQSADYLFTKVFEKYARDFDTILVSAYWHDVGDEVFTKYEKRGARLVSMGFRGDQNFVRRLKTIFSLSDAVVTDAIGTHIGFCYYLNKPVFMENSTDYQNLPYGMEMNKQFYEAFHSDNMSFTEEQRGKQKELYEQHWGGSCIRTPEEGRAILHIAREIRKRAHNVSLREFADKAVEQYLWELEGRSDEEAKIEHRIMLEALGRQ